jgi:hypothetical protein
VATLTSKKFIAGNGILFLALSEEKMESPEIPFSLNVSILDSDGEILDTYPLATSIVALSPGCPSDANDARFSRHFINTQAYRGTYIKLRFSQHAETAQSGGFTLIDQVSLVYPGETTISRDAPLAKAGVKYDETGQSLYLVAALPEGDINHTRDWRYSWYINGENQPRHYYNPCISDLGIGHYTAILTVQTNDGIARDSLNFSISETSDETSVNDVESKQDSLLCNLRHPLDAHSKLRIQAVDEQ